MEQDLHQDNSPENEKNSLSLGLGRLACANARGDIIFIVADWCKNNGNLEMNCTFESRDGERICPVDLSIHDKTLSDKVAAIISNFDNSENKIAQIVSVLDRKLTGKPSYSYVKSNPEPDFAEIGQNELIQVTTSDWYPSLEHFLSSTRYQLETITKSEMVSGKWTVSLEVARALHEHGQTIGVQLRENLVPEIVSISKWRTVADPFLADEIMDTISEFKGEFQACNRNYYNRFFHEKLDRCFSGETYLTGDATLLSSNGTSEAADWRLQLEYPSGARILFTYDMFDPTIRIDSNDQTNATSLYIYRDRPEYFPEHHFKEIAENLTSTQVRPNYNGLKIFLGTSADFQVSIRFPKILSLSDRLVPHVDESIESSGFKRLHGDGESWFPAIDIFHVIKGREFLHLSHKSRDLDVRIILDDNSIHEIGVRSRRIGIVRATGRADVLLNGDDHKLSSYIKKLLGAFGDNELSGLGILLSQRAKISPIWGLDASAQYISSLRLALNLLEYASYFESLSGFNPKDIGGMIHFLSKDDKFYVPFPLDSTALLVAVSGAAGVEKVFVARKPKARWFSRQMTVDSLEQSKISEDYTISSLIGNDTGLVYDMVEGLRGAVAHNKKGIFARSYRRSAKIRDEIDTILKRFS